MDSVFDTNLVLSKLDQNSDGKYFLGFLQTNSFEAGLLRLEPGEMDTQGPHSADEIYFVIEGDGCIQIEDKSHSIKKGSCVFVPSKTKHYFYGNRERIVVLYVFSNHQ